MVGTAGSLRNDALLSDASLFLRFRLSARAGADDALDVGTDWPAAMSPGPSSGLEGLDEEHRRWWPRARTGAAAAAKDEGATDEATAATEAWAAPADRTTRRTDEGNMVCRRLVPKGGTRGGGGQVLMWMRGARGPQNAALPNAFLGGRAVSHPRKVHDYIWSTLITCTLK